MLLYADCGNTRIKVGLAGQRACLLPDADALEGWLGDREPSGLIMLPGAAASAEVVRTWWPGERREAGSDLPAPDRGQYPGMGLDRVVAGLAAGPDCIVVDAGTATTLTAWDGSGRFAGGLILPGAHAMLAGLVARAPALPLVEPGPPISSAAQRDTRGAIAAGAGIGHPAMVAACLIRLRDETGITRVVATGGGAETLAAAEVFPATAIRPWLVLDGLAMLASS